MNAQPYNLIYTIKLGFIFITTVMWLMLHTHASELQSQQTPLNMPPSMQSHHEQRMPEFKIDSGAYETNPNYIEEDSWHNKRNLPKKPTVVSA